MIRSLARFLSALPYRRVGVCGVLVLALAMSAGCGRKPHDVEPPAPAASIESPPQP